VGAGGFNHPCFSYLRTTYEAVGTSLVAAKSLIGFFEAGGNYD
jgi:hypothetical protein